MKVTGVPGQMVVAVELIETDAITLACTVIVIEFDVAGEPVAQLKLDVRIQVTASVSFNVELVNVFEFVPVFIPFTCH